MKIINFIHPKNCVGYRMLIDIICMSMRYEQASKVLADAGYYLPKDQFEAATILVDTMIELDIGHRQKERA